MCTYRVSNAYHIIASAPGSEAGRVGRQLELIRAWTAASDFAFEANSTLLRAAIRSPAPAPAPAATPTRVWARPGLIVASVEIILTSYAHAQLSNQATNSPSWSVFAKDPLLYTVPLSLSLFITLPLMQLPLRLSLIWEFIELRPPCGFACIFSAHFADFNTSLLWLHWLLPTTLQLQVQIHRMFLIKNCRKIWSLIPVRFRFPNKFSLHFLGYS